MKDTTAITGGRPEELLRISTTAELLKAVELGIVDRTEARSLLGFGVKRGRWAKVQPRAGGRFTKDEVLPFNRFSEEAKQALLVAQGVADGQGRSQVATGDLLVALAGQSDGPGALALHVFGAGEEAVRSALAALAVNEVGAEGLGTTAELKSAMEFGFRSVAYPDEVGTEDLLLALAAGEGAAKAVLTQFGATPEAIRARLQQLEAEVAAPD
jgi:hypothetical protein